MFYSKKWREAWHGMAFIYTVLYIRGGLHASYGGYFVYTLELVSSTAIREI